MAPSVLNSGGGGSGTAQTSSNAADNNKKQRLSRKEQKARRKQKKKTNGDDDGAHANGNTEPAEEKPHQGPPAASASDDREPDAKDYLASYEPTPIPTDLVDNEQDTESKHQNNKKQQGAKSLGKWFPSAIKLKSTVAPTTTTSADKNNETTTTPPTCSLLLFYQYVTPRVWSDERVRLLMRYLCRIHEHRHGNLAGRIRIAPEGLNATLTAVDCCINDKIVSAAATLRHFAQDLIQFDSVVFQQTDFKYTDGLRADRHFTQLNLLPVKELVYYGLDEKAAPLAEGGTHVSPEEFHRYLAGGDDQKETVVIDVRNHYEAAIGRFDGQQQLVKQQQRAPQSSTKQEKTTTDTNSKDKSAPASSTVATYIDPKMRKSTDFPTWLAQKETRELLSNKRVLLYCTGGIRCERASAHLKHVAAASSLLSQPKPKTTTTASTNNDDLHNSSEKKQPATGNDDSIAIPPPAEIYQLQGGIERYLKAYPDGGFWRGKNYTFDKREAVSVEDPNGDGGVVRKQDKKRQKAGVVATEDCICVVCRKPWDRYIGKQHCRCCGVPVLCCDKCLSSKKTTTPESMLLRCPLCVEQNVTVPAQDVVYTNNGVAVAVAADINNTSKDHKAKAAPSVCKWGGGHAVEKKRKRRLQSKPCRFGADCTRPDCFFAHPSAASSAKTKKK